MVEVFAVTVNPEADVMFHGVPFPERLHVHVPDPMVIALTVPPAGFELMDEAVTLKLLALKVPLLTAIDPPPLVLIASCSV